jgi:hypothetical protein
VWGLRVKKQTIVGALLACLMFSPLHAEEQATETKAGAHPKTFVGVMWPMFGPMAAPGLVELVAELKTMPNVQVETYVHQAWPSLVDDLNAMPPGRHTIVIGYSLGANSTAEVANRVHHVDEFIALQPSELSWNPDIKGGSYGRFVEIYNPNEWETMGGMGSKKLVGPNIEYIANHDSHPGAQFSSQFRNLVKTEVAKLSTAEPVEVAQAQPAAPLGYAEDNKLADEDGVGDDNKAPGTNKVVVVGSKTAKVDLPRSTAKTHGSDLKAARADTAQPVKVALADATPSPKIARTDVAAPQKITRAELPPLAQALPQPKAATAAMPKRVDTIAFLDQLSGAVDSGDLSAEPQLTASAMMDYAKRAYHVHPDMTASCLPGCGQAIGK